MALEPARAITKTRAPDFLFLHEKDFWFKQIWVDLHQTMVLDREGSYTRPVLGLVRCVCKDETEQMVFLLRAPFGQYGPVAAFEP